MHVALRLAALRLCLPASDLPILAAQSTPPSASGSAPVAGHGDGDEGPTLSPTHLKFSDPAKPGKIRLRVMWGNITVTGADTQAVTIVANIKNKQQAQAKNPDGLRRLDSETTYTATEKDNVISIELGGDSPEQYADATLAITTPRNTSVSVENTFGGRVDVKNIEGDIDIRGLNGEVTLDRIAGSALVETMNGEIHATFVKVTEGKPLFFSSMNGAIEVRIPANTKANVRLRTQNGAVLTDFDEKALITTTEAAHGRMTNPFRAPLPSANEYGNSDWHDDIRDTFREATEAGLEAARDAVVAARDAAQAAREGVAQAPLPPVLPTISGGKIVTGTLNGGGPEIQIATMNGTITLRKTQP
jgi:hypothetical protein